MPRGASTFALRARNFHINQRKSKKKKKDLDPLFYIKFFWTV
jgi:hypothetical protein